MPEPPARRLFIAGSTGAVGRHVVALAEARGHAIVPHVRPKSSSGHSLHPDAAVLDLGDGPLLDEALAGCTTVIQLIGTMRKRFAAGDTYETSDIATTRHLVEAAGRGGLDHLVLLSSTGAGRPMGAYLRAKAAAEQLVRDSGLDWTIFRPSSFDGEGHRPPPGLRWATSAFQIDRLRPIEVPTLAQAIVHAAGSGGARNQVLEGKSLWQWVEEARLAQR